MKILFSPSESKSQESVHKSINEDSFIFPSLYQKRLEIVNKFSVHVYNASVDELREIYGTKDEEECLRLKKLNLLNSQTIEAIQRYRGVAYEYLDFKSLSECEKNYLYNGVLIFSNLFGPLMAKDKIPYYKLKQGSKIRDFKIEAFYKQNFSKEIDALLQDEFVIDLRAGFYEKFYTLKQPYITMKFLKDSKVVSHWAKAYRGMILRDLAKYKPESIEEFENIKFKNLHVKEIIESKHKREYIFEIVEL